ncbi:LCP family protein [Streptomyces paludis]|uniref:LytR family transcriptional regulator n=1 Tax=Streptomyces paludis TaxID=2282738 RepID=A0A345HNA9_9ACTN|nr:LCP family protein [Streptomyces paludis]AXG78183.1 LytR family transcriptional regulator [Streptomyces paludis]
MDEDVTDSAGTPPEPNENSGAGSGTESGSTDGTTHGTAHGTADGTADRTTHGTADESADGTAVEAGDGIRDAAADEYRAALTAVASAMTAALTAAASAMAAAVAAGTPADAPAAVRTDISADAQAKAPLAPPKPPKPLKRRKRRWLRWVAVGAAAAVLASGGAGWWFYRQLDHNITTDTTTAAELQTYEKERPKPVVLDAENILLVGSDSRAGKNGKYGRDDGGSQRSDTTILLHLAADRKSATAVSFPRDLMVDIPSCRRSDGSRTRAQFAQFNWAFEFGGAACTIRTIEKLTGIRVDHHMVVDFQGFKDMVDAVDGVKVCLKEPVDDKNSKLKLDAGTHTLDGEQALAYVRARHSLGDGSDTQRMGRQQRFLGALFKKVRSNGVLLNPTQLYPVLDAATKSVTTDPGLGSLSALYDLTRSMRSVPTEKVQFLTVPRQQYSLDRNRDELVQPAAGKLFEQLRDDAAVTVVPASKDDDTAPSASPSPDGGDTVFEGTNAAAGVCE